MAPGDLPGPNGRVNCPAPMAGPGLSASPLLVESFARSFCRRSSQVVSTGCGQLVGIRVMPVGLLGRKVGMTQVYDDQGNLHAVTVIEVGPCTVLALRTKDRDGYEAVQLGFGDKHRRLASRAERGQVANING